MNLFESSIEDSRREVQKYLGVIRRVRHKDLYVGRVREQWGRVNELEEAIREMEKGIEKKSRELREGKGKGKGAEIWKSVG